MLQRLSHPFDEELYAGDGLWSRQELEIMDAAFCARVEAAFAAGLESRAAARATIQVKSSLNGSRQRAEEAAIESAWRYLRENIEAGVDVSFVEVLAFARERCSDVTAEQVRVEFKKRFKGRWQSTATSAA